MLRLIGKSSTKVKRLTSNNILLIKLPSLTLKPLVNSKSTTRSSIKSILVVLKDLIPSRTWASLILLPLTIMFWFLSSKMMLKLTTTFPLFTLLTFCCSLWWPAKRTNSLGMSWSKRTVTLSFSINTKKKEWTIWTSNPSTKTAVFSLKTKRI